MIKITLGTEQFPFVRLLEWVDRAINDGYLSAREDILVQSGSTVYSPKHENMKLTPFVPYNEQMQQFADARIAIIHAGIGNTLDLVDLQKTPILVPRDPKYGEHIDGHQLDFAQHAKDDLHLPVAYTYEEFIAALSNYSAQAAFTSTKNELVHFLKEVVESS
jgi:UDP-N-acetylglucosamine transferase subunit ALG13